MVHPGSFEQDVVYGWTLSEEQLAKLFLLDVENWDMERVADIDGENDIENDEMFYGWKMDTFRAGDHDQKAVYGCKTGMNLSNFVTSQWDTLDDMITFSKQAQETVDTNDLRAKAQELPLVKKYPEFFIEEPQIYLANNDCLCCS